jgi:hypothetical protein
LVDGEEAAVKPRWTPRLHVTQSTAWALPTKGTFFVPEGAEEQPVLRYLDFANGHALEISFLQMQPSHIWISPSVDGKRLLLQQLDMRVSNVMLVENFR